MNSDLMSLLLNQIKLWLPPWLVREKTLSLEGFLFLYRFKTSRIEIV